MNATILRVLVFVSGIVCVSGLAWCDDGAIAGQQAAPRRPSSEELRHARTRIRWGHEAEKENNQVRKQLRRIGYDRCVLFGRLLATTIANALPQEGKQDAESIFTLGHRGGLRCAGIRDGQSFPRSSEVHASLDWELGLGSSVLAIISIEERSRATPIGSVIVDGVSLQVAVPFVGQTSPFAPIDAGERSVDERLPELNGMSIRELLKKLFAKSDDKATPAVEAKPRGIKSAQLVHWVGYDRLVIFQGYLERLGLEDEGRVCSRGEIGHVISFGKEYRAREGDVYQGALEWSLLQGEVILATIEISPIETDESIGVLEIRGMTLYIYLRPVIEGRSIDDHLPELDDRTLRSLFHPLRDAGVFLH